MSIAGLSGILNAQNLADTWEVFDVATQNAHHVEINNLQKPENSSGPVITSIVSDDDRVEVTGRASDLEKAVVVLEMNIKGQKALCSGSMVGPNLVLTAAHCLNHQGNYMDGVTVYAVGMPASGGRVAPLPDNPIMDDEALDEIFR